MLTAPSKNLFTVRPKRLVTVQPKKVVTVSPQKYHTASRNLFLFLNKRGNTIKGLYWDRNGFCLWIKRLEKDKFHWPRGTEEARELSGKELQWLLDGLDLEKLTPHQNRTYSSVL